MFPQVDICDVALRDGLQNLSFFVPTETKLSLFGRLVGCGIRELEVTGFVHPKAIPQFTDAEAVLQAASKQSKVAIKSLIPNGKGAMRALDAGAKELVFVFSASEAHNQSNVNMTVAQSLDQLHSITELAKDRNGAGLQVDLGTTFGYYQDPVSLDTIESLTERIIGLGINKIMYCDTSGFGDPLRVAALIQRIRPAYPRLTFGFHLHDTYGTAIANCVKALESGVGYFESSIAGLGGCPFAVNASGNVATEDLVWILEKMGVDTGIDMDRLIETGSFIKEHILKGQPVTSRVYNAMGAPKRTGNTFCR